MAKPILQNSSNTSNLPIGWFVLLSLVLHALLFWGVVRNETGTTAMPAAQVAADGLHINLRPYRVPTQAHKAKPAPQPMAKKSPDAAPQPVAETAHSSIAENRQEVNAAFRARIMVKLRRSLAAHFVYPLLARQRNWQGEVLLTFRVERDGRISDVRIARSSGYGLLDHDALSALTKVNRIDENMPRDLSIELPVIYRLEG